MNCHIRLLRHLASTGLAWREAVSTRNRWLVFSIQILRVLNSMPSPNEEDRQPNWNRQNRTTGNRTDLNLTDETNRTKQTKRTDRILQSG